MVNRFFASISLTFLLILFVSLVLRILIALYSFSLPENTDVMRYKDWARIAYLYGFADTYKTDHLTFGTLANNNPPGVVYILSGPYVLQLQTAKIIAKITHSAIGSNIWVNGPLVSFFLRIPSIISDLIIGFLIYIVVKQKKSKKNAYIASCLFLFNPVVLYNSSLWGQLDAINNVFFYLCLFFLIKEKYFWSILMYVISLFIKLSLLPLFPIIFLLLWKKEKSKKKIILYAVISLIIILVFTLPISSQPLSWLVLFVKENGSGEIQSITAFAFNFWWVIYRPWISIGNTTSLFNFSQIRLHNSPSSKQLFLSLTLATWGYILFFLSLIPIIWNLIKINKKHVTPEVIFLISSVCTMLIFLFLPSMHERYLYPLLPLLATYVGMTGKFLKTFLLLTILNFINLYIVWHPMLLPLLNRSTINDQNFQWIISIFTIITCGYFYIQSVKKIYYAKIS